MPLSLHISSLVVSFLHLLLLSMILGGNQHILCQMLKIRIETF